MVQADMPAAAVAADGTHAATGIRANQPPSHTPAAAAPAAISPVPVAPGAAAGTSSPHDSTTQQQQLLLQYLDYEVQVKAHCAAEPEVLQAVNDMSCIALRAIAGSSAALHQSKDQLLQQYLDLEAHVLTFCASSSSSLVEALSSMSNIALRALTQG